MLPALLLFALHCAGQEMNKDVNGKTKKKKNTCGSPQALSMCHLGIRQVLLLVPILQLQKKAQKVKSHYPFNKY